MLKKILTTLASGAVLPIMWWNVVPSAVNRCDNGVPVPFTVMTDKYEPDGSIISYELQGKLSTQLCVLVRDFPKPVTE